MINPSFDITPAEYITAVITEEGVCTAPLEDSLREAYQKARVQLKAAANPLGYM